MVCRFLGTQSEIEPYVSLTYFGQSVELPEEIFKQALGTHDEGGCALLPESDFAALGFTADELREFADAASHAEAPADFLAKKKQGLMRVHELRDVAMSKASQVTAEAITADAATSANSASNETQSA